MSRRRLTAPVALCVLGLSLLLGACTSAGDYATTPLPTPSPTAAPSTPAAPAPAHPPAPTSRPRTA